MTIRAALSVFVFFAAALPLAAQSLPEDNLDWTGMEQALSRASGEDKMILIDVYAEWCPYCQRMQREVYPDETVEEQINTWFIPVRINTESDEPVHYLGHRFTEAEFAGALQYRSVPTTFFMNPEGEIVGQQPGYLPADVFARLLEYVGSGAYESVTFEEFESQ